MATDTQEAESYQSSFWSLIILVLLSIWAYNAWFTPDKWTGIYELPYTNVIQSAGDLSSRMDCAQWKDSKTSDPQGAYNIECGKNCKAPTTEMGLYQCEETF